MPRTSALCRPFSYEPEILYDYRWAKGMRFSAARIAGALNLSSTQEIDALWYDNAETRRIVTIWSDFVKKEQVVVDFEKLWRRATMFMDAMTAPVPPQIGVQNVTQSIFHLVFASWCITQLMRVVPTLFPRSNLDTIPPKLDAYDFLHARCIILRGRNVRKSQARYTMPPRAAMPVKWHREPSTDRLNIPSPVSANRIEEPPTALTSTTALEPEHALPVTSGGDKIGSPKEGAISDYTGTREMLYQFAGKLCEQFQQVQLSVESDEAQKDGNGSTQFAGIDGLIEQYTKIIGGRCIGETIAKNQPLGQLASHCAQMSNQIAGETGRVEEAGPGGDIGPGVKHSGKHSQAAPRTQISWRNNGVSKNRTRPSRVHNTGSNERIQAAFNSELAGTSNSPDQLDAVNSSNVIELDSIIEIDLTED
ncbi:hypothetical protein N7517_003347 [Penicillium concentricum]|uniref:Uncharacterized protein n=1 Tax=Penicillium concentricum TaxID=293559 RepID=A0A9W9VLT5_9EURO|nr:uncharacterized protein N7517_003347 [Penicillium concentricum]KAJ5385436.1 hypothetical protein N7517_003347 [Penicillium concentricum]